MCEISKGDIIFLCVTNIYRTYCLSSYYSLKILFIKILSTKVPCLFSLALFIDKHVLAYDIFITLQAPCSNVRGEPTASVLLADGFLLMAGPKFQPSDGNPIVISILWQLADVLEDVPEI